MSTHQEPVLQGFEIEVLADLNGATTGWSQGTIIAYTITEEAALRLAIEKLWDAKLDVAHQRRLRVTHLGSQPPAGISDWHIRLAVDSEVYFLHSNDIRNAGNYVVKEIMSTSGQVVDRNTVVRLKSKVTGHQAEAFAKELYASAPGNWTLFSGTWHHPFGPGQQPTQCRIVIHANEYTLVAAQAWSGLSWVNLSLPEKKDLSESLFEANNVHEDPQAFDLSAVTELPAWAQPQMIDSPAAIGARKRYIVPAFVVVEAESSADVAQTIKAGGLQALADTNGFRVAIDARIPIREVSAATGFAVNSLLDACPPEALQTLVPSATAEEYL